MISFYDFSVIAETLKSAGIITEDNERYAELNIFWDGMQEYQWVVAVHLDGVRETTYEAFIEYRDNGTRPVVVLVDFENDSRTDLPVVDPLKSLSDLAKNAREKASESRGGEKFFIHRAQTIDECIEALKRGA